MYFIRNILVESQQYVDFEKIVMLKVTYCK